MGGVEPLMNMSKEEMLKQFLKKEHGYYRAILDITHQAHQSLILGKPMSELAPLIKKKQILMSCIQDIEKALPPLKKFWKEKKIKTDPLSLEIQEQFKSLSSLLAEILKLDDVNQQCLQNYIQSLKEQERKLHQQSTEKL